MGERIAKRKGFPAGSDMNRRDFLKLGGSSLAGAALLGVIGCGTGNQGGGQGTAGDQASTSIRVGNFYNEATTYGQALNRFEKNIKEASNGEIKVQVLHAELGGEQEHIQAVNSGSLEMMETGTAGIGLYVPEVAIFELWYAYKNIDQLIEAFESLTSELDKMYQEEGFKLLGAYYDGPRNILSKKKVQTVDELQGLKFRVPSSELYVNAANAMGAKAVDMAYTEVYTGLQTGAVQAMEGTPDSVLQENFYEQAQFYIQDRHVYQPLSIVYNLAAWEAMPEEHKEIVQDAVKESSDHHLSLVEKANSDALKELHNKGIELVEVQDRENWKEAAAPANRDFVDKYGEKGKIIAEAVREATSG